MTGAPLTEGQLRAQVTAVRAKAPKARFLGIRASAWSGPARLRVQDEEVEVVWCVSALAVAERMAEAPAEGPLLVLVTDRTNEDLGTDVLVRLARRRLFSIDPWQMALELFQAHRLDPRVAQETWMAEALLESVPPGGYAAVKSGVLDLDTAWSALLAHYGLPDARPDDEALLRWAGSDGPRLLESAPVARREGILHWLGSQGGAVCGAIAGTVRAGRAADALAIGLCARVVFGARSEGRLVEAAVRIEPLCGGIRLLDADGRRWADLSERFAREALSRGELDRWSDCAAAILDELRARDHAWRSPVLLDGLEQRLDHLGRAALRIVAGEGKPEEAVIALTAVRDHALAQKEADRVEVATMAVRLLHWLAHAAARPDPTSFVTAVDSYRDDDAWADRARTVLRAGDRSTTMAEACNRLAARVLQVREAENQRFARLLAAYTATGTRDERLVPVEDLVARVVAPLAAKHPVLLLVLDGMSVGVCQDLVEDLAPEWLEVAPVGARRQVSLSALPSITQVSRTSLFVGALRCGGQSAEMSGFAQHPALRAITRAGHPPVVFHKADLSEAGATLAEDVRAAILSTSRQVVAVVVNAIDDHLAKGDQIPVRWSRRTIRPLSLLLDAARRAGRVVVMISDHGHLLDTGVELRKEDGGGSRWRPAASDAALAADEVLLEGPRVLAGSATRVVALATERIRYGTKHSGYHGGATPQEVVVPVVVLVAEASDLAPSWVELSVAPPLWWDAGDVAAAPPAPRKGQLELPTSTSDTGEGSPWIAQLLASPVYRAQRKRFERGVATDDQVTRVIGALAQSGGAMTRAGLARALDLPHGRLVTVLAAVRRLLNVEGYAVLAVNDVSDSVVLDWELLSRQFDLPRVKS